MFHFYVNFIPFHSLFALFSYENLQNRKLQKFFANSLQNALWWCSITATNKWTTNVHQWEAVDIFSILSWAPPHTYYNPREVILHTLIQPANLQDGRQKAHNACKPPGALSYRCLAFLCNFERQQRNERNNDQKAKVKQLKCLTLIRRFSHKFWANRLADLPQMTVEIFMQIIYC